jgi:hypothetical protein
LRRIARIQNERVDEIHMPEIALENGIFDVCEFATLAIPSTGIGGEILQIGQTWLQCRQQAEWVCQVLQEKIREHRQQNGNATKGDPAPPAWMKSTITVTVTQTGET